MSHLKGETSRITISFFCSPKGLEGIKKDLIDEIAKKIKDLGIEIPNGVMITNHRTISKELANS